MSDGFVRLKGDTRSLGFDPDPPSDGCPQCDCPLCGFQKLPSCQDGQVDVSSGFARCPRRSCFETRNPPRQLPDGTWEYPEGYRPLPPLRRPK